MASPSNSSKNVLPRGKYTVVAVDLDTTGRRLKDEIVKIGGFELNSNFGEYILPRTNLNFAAMKRHRLRVVPIGNIRALKSIKEKKLVTTKSEFVALKDFINFLEQAKKKDENSTGVILIYHGENKQIPLMILEALRKYDLLEKFKTIVKSFANVRNPKSNSKSKSEEDENTDGDAWVRAKLVYERSMNQKDALDSILKYAKEIRCDLEELKKEEKIVNNEMSLRPIFVHYFQASPKHRARAVMLRNILAKNKNDHKKLSEIWSKEGREGLSKHIQNIKELKNEDKTELIDLLDCFFDPSKEEIKPIVKAKKNKNKRSAGNKKNNKENIPPKKSVANSTPKKKNNKTTNLRPSKSLANLATNGKDAKTTLRSSTSLANLASKPKRAPRSNPGNTKK